jgi:hypothetical protein
VRRSFPTDPLRKKLKATLRWAPEYRWRCAHGFALALEM